MLSAAVLAFQAAIFLTIVVAGSVSKRALIFATTGWVLFTLFGSIVTAGLMLLQLVTIVLAYNVATARSRGRNAESFPQAGAPISLKVSSPVRAEVDAGRGAAATRIPEHLPAPRKGDAGGVLAVLGLIGLVVLILALASTGGNNAAQAPVRPHLGAPVTSVTASPAKAAQAPRGVATKKDLRHCLALETNEAIAKCAEQ